MKLPIGIQDFEKIRTENLLFIDKTKQIHELITTGDYYFLARPRRFGKSLLLSTMRALYEGKQDLFEGLWIYDQWDWTKIYPVIHIQFASQGIRNLGTAKAIEQMLGQIATTLNIELNTSDFSSQFKELIRKAALQSPTGKAVVLIDEYDKPIIDYLDNLPQAVENRNTLKAFYSILKDSDPYLELVFITGVSRFSKTSIFSDLNNLTNLTMRRQAVQLLGVTQEELDVHFSDAIKDIAKEQGIQASELRTQIKSWYNGYSWDGKHKVYNPFSLLSFFMAREFDNFWFETGTPTFLVHEMLKHKLFNIDTVRATDSILDNFNIEALNPTTVLFQAGYLTIGHKITQGIYELKYPNQEVKQSLQEYLLNAFTYDPMEQGKIHALDIAQYFKAGNIDGVLKIINAVFATIPYQLWQKDNEHFYHALIHLTFSLVGVFVQSEINSSNGRLDAMIETDDTIYIIEFKLDKSAEEALQQINEKQYFLPYQSNPKEKIGLGINFSTATKAIESYLSSPF